MRRAAVVAVAAAVLTGLGLTERSVRLQASGFEAVQHGDLAAAEAEFRAARVLNPDTLPDIQRVFVLERSGRSQAAGALLDDVLRREPDNLEAWGLLYRLTRERDPASAQRALDARARLDPFGAR